MDNKNLTNETNELKDLWKSQKEEKSYDSAKIFKMIHRKSINSVQWLFIISLAELVLGLATAAWSYFSGFYYHGSSAEIIGEENIHKMELFTNVSFIFSLCLIVVIYYYYRKISSDSSVHALINNIIKFRKIVIICMVAIVVILLSFMFPIYLDIGQSIAAQNVLNNENINIEDYQKAIKASGWFVAILSTFVFGLFFFVYYYLIYGFFLRRLKKNQKELNKIEN